MGIEIERKFLVRGDGWRSAEPQYICQGYLNRDEQRTVRVRIVGDSALLTIKKTTAGATRMEFEFPIPVDDARQLMGLCDGPLVEKNRRRVHFGEHVWEVDEFLGENEGLVVAEIELGSEEEQFERPDWLGQEVTHDLRYFNARLSSHPFRMWAENLAHSES